MSLSEFLQDLNATLPLVVLIVWASLLLVADLFIPKERKVITALLSALGLLVTLGVVIARSTQPSSAFNGMIANDGFSAYLQVLFLVSGLLAIILAFDYMRRMNLERGEFYVLLLFSIVGMMLMASAADLIMVFLALELLSIPLYVLAGFAVPRLESEEAALKYFLLGSFSTGILVFGVAMIFGATGNTSLSAIIASIDSGAANTTLLLAGAGLLLIGLGFKVSVVPFHMWTPDVYQGAPTSVTAFMAAGAKAAGFAALLRVFVLAFPSLAKDMAPVLWGLSALTMILGNIVAIAQSNIKRLLAYSSIAQAGYILMALVPYGNPTAGTAPVASALLYLLAYAFTSFTAWAVIISLEQAEGKGLSLDDYAGLGRKYPVLGAAMAIAMLSFTGVPPTLGFVGKFYIFSTILKGGNIGLALIGVLTSLISAYYYLRVIVIMYMRDGDPIVHRERVLYITTAVIAACTVLLSIFATPLFNWVSQAVLEIF